MGAGDEEQARTKQEQAMASKKRENKLTEF